MGLFDKKKLIPPEPKIERDDEVDEEEVVLSPTERYQLETLFKSRQEDVTKAITILEKQLMAEYYNSKDKVKKEYVLKLQYIEDIYGKKLKVIRNESKSKLEEYKTLAEKLKIKLKNETEIPNERKREELPPKYHVEDTIQKEQQYTTPPGPELNTELITENPELSRLLKELEKIK